MKFKIFETTADIGLTIFGQTIEELFENAIYGFYYLLVENKNIDSKTEKVIELDFTDNLELDLVNLLSELIFLFDKYNWLTKEAKIKIENNKLIGQLKGEKFDENKHKLWCLIKGVTYHLLKVEKKDKIWQATVVFDV